MLLKTNADCIALMLCLPQEYALTGKLTVRICGVEVVVVLKQERSAME